MMERKLEYDRSKEKLSAVRMPSRASSILLRGFKSNVETSFFIDKTSPGGTITPFTPSLTYSLIPPLFVTTTATPQCIASSVGREKPSIREGRAKTAALLYK